MCLLPVMKVLRPVMVLDHFFKVLVLAKTVLVLTICGLGLDHLVWS